MLSDERGFPFLAARSGGSIAGKPRGRINSGSQAKRGSCNLHKPRLACEAARLGPFAGDAERALAQSPPESTQGSAFLAESARARDVEEIPLPWHWAADPAVATTAT